VNTLPQDLKNIFCFWNKTYILMFKTLAPPIKDRYCRKSLYFYVQSAIFHSNDPEYERSGAESIFFAFLLSPKLCIV